MGGGRERNGGFLEAGSDSGGVPVRHLHIVSTRRRAAALLFGSFEQFARTAAARASSSWMRLVFSFPTHQSLITVGSWIESYVFERTSSEDRVRTNMRTTSCTLHLLPLASSFLLGRLFWAGSFGQLFSGSSSWAALLGQALLGQALLGRLFWVAPFGQALLGRL